MNILISLHDIFFSMLERLARPVLPSLARLVFAGVLLGYYWASALTKMGDGLLGLFRPSLGAYAQIFPRQMEAVGYDLSQMTIFHWLVVEAGMLAEFILPALIVIGLFSRLASLGMIGFILVQSLTDIVGHQVDVATRGAWFDPIPDALVVDQRAFWILTLLIVVFLGAGPLSADRLLRRQAASG
jgi:putative oxidoreductase